MKKPVTLFLTAFFVLAFICNVFASNATNCIYSETISVDANERITIPVKIQNNKGFMGFAILVTYDKNVFTPVSASKDSMLSGMFNDSIATSVNNSFKVVFTGTSNVTADGELFNIVFDVADDVSGKYEIELSYSQQDTFNENWDNVVFNCENVEVIVTENGTTATTSEPTTVITTESTTQKQETTTQTITTEPSTNEPVTTEPSVEETTTPSVTEPSTEPEDEEKPLSVRMREWVNGLPFPLNIILGIFIIPVAFIISIFE